MILLRTITTFLALLAPAYGYDLNSSGGWSVDISAANLINYAGSNLEPELESASGVSNLSVTNGSGGWTVSMRKSGGHSNVRIFVKRTSGGIGNGNISGGTAYLELTGSNTVFFTGTQNKTGISLQYKLTGLSIDIPPAVYLSSITFTVQ